jgi:spore germination protein KC
MKKLFTVIILLFSLSNLTGCKAGFLPQRREISDLQLVQVIGADKSVDNPDSSMLTIASKKLTDGGGQDSTGSGGEGRSSKGEKAQVLTSEGKTIFDAARNIQTHSDKTIFWGHTDYYLIGEEAAKESINKYIDFSPVTTSFE